MEQTTAPGESSDPSTARLKQDIEHTRDDLSETVAALEERLSPSQLRTALREEVQEVEQKVRVVLGEQLTEAKALVHAEVREAKEALQTGMADAERMIRSGLHDAKETVKHEVKDAVSAAKDSLRAATFGRVENFATQVGDTMNDVRDSLLDTIYSNPLPATLAGVGIAWLLMNRSRSASIRAQGYAGNGGTGDYGRQQMGSRIGETVGQMGAVLGQVTQQASGAVAQGLHGVTDTASEMLEGASGMATDVAYTAAEGVSQAAHTVADGASAIADRAQAGAKRVERTFQRQLQERPLAIGAAAVAIGTMVGCALPRTRAEDNLMGEARTSMLSRAGDVVQEAAASLGVGSAQQDDEATQNRQTSQGDRGQGGRNSADERKTQSGQREQRSGKPEGQGSQGAQGKQSEQQRSRREPDGKSATKS
jgi:hypothetical protein